MKSIALVAAVLGGGCSFLTHGPARSPASCNPSRFAPGFDTYQAVGNAVVAVAALSEFDDSEADIGALIAVPAAILAAAHGAGASYGFRHARGCRELRAALPPPILVPVEEPPPIVIEEETETTRTRRTIIVPTH